MAVVYTGLIKTNSSGVEFIIDAQTLTVLEEHLNESTPLQLLAD